MTKYNCPGCQQKLSVPDEYAGKRVRCNKCNQPSMVPYPVSAGVVELQPPTVSEPLKLMPDIESPHDSLPPLDPNQTALQEVSRLRAKMSADSLVPISRRRGAPRDDSSPHWYWPFVFPFKGAALGMIGVFLVCKVILFFVAMLPIMMIGFVVMMLSVIVQAYICWYLYLCVQTTAVGTLQSPDILQENEGGVSEMVGRALRMLAAGFVCFAPAIIYLGWKLSKSGQEGDTMHNQIDGIFWCILSAGLFFFPMALLSVIMNDSLGGLNPILIVMSILRTPLQYPLMVLCFSAPLLLTGLVGGLSEKFGFWFALPAEALSYYFAFVGAAILGRFFYRNEKRLDWAV